MNPLFSARTSVEQVEEGLFLAPKFDCNGLIPVVTTDANTGEVLMHAYMNKEGASYVALGFPQQSLMSPAPVVACDTNHVINNTNIPSARVS